MSTEVAETNSSFQRGMCWGPWGSWVERADSSEMPRPNRGRCKIETEPLKQGGTKLSSTAHHPVNLSPRFLSSLEESLNQLACSLSLVLKEHIFPGPGGFQRAGPSCFSLVYRSRNWTVALLKKNKIKEKETVGVVT